MVSRPKVRPLVVVESCRPEARDLTIRRLFEAGFEVVACPGPRHLHAGGCPLVETGDCPQAGRASAVVHDLDLDDPEDREVLLTLRARYPQLPIVVEATDLAALDHIDLLEGCAVVPPDRVDQLAQMVHRAVQT